MTNLEAIAFFMDMDECTYGGSEPIQMAIKALEQDAIHIPEGATNGEVFMAMFPNARTWEVTRDNIRCACVEFDDICEIKTFPLSWWDAPYKGVQNLCSTLHSRTGKQWSTSL